MADDLDCVASQVHAGVAGDRRRAVYQTHAGAEYPPRPCRDHAVSGWGEHEYHLRVGCLNGGCPVRVCCAVLSYAYQDAHDGCRGGGEDPGFRNDGEHQDAVACRHSRYPVACHGRPRVGAAIPATVDHAQAGAGRVRQGWRMVYAQLYAQDGGRFVVGASR